MKKFAIITLMILISISTFLLGFNYNVESVPNNLYQVYLDNKKIGIIESKEELEQLIDKRGEEYKNKFNVDKVYAPTGLEIKKLTTYSDKVNTVEEVYDIISKEKPFTIQGYQLTIKKENETVKIYTTTKEIIDESIETTIETFVGKEAYEAYLNETQTPIETTGTIINNIYISNDMTIKQTYIPVTESIFTENSELEKYFLFGTDPQTSNYTVVDGDTIENIAFKNQISVDELLLSNPTFNSASNLVFTGQEIVISATNPQISVVTEEYVVEDIESQYKTEEKFDSTKNVGYEEVLQEGENGLERVSKNVQSINGEIVYVKPVSKEELKPSTTKIILKGDRIVSGVGTLNNWAWPTNSGYIISSDYAYRIHPITGIRHLHTGIDIAGTGYGSPVYASNNGVVYKTGYQSSMGNYIMINHNNGYYTIYEHLAQIMVKPNQIVEKGQQIGKIGMTGSATGPHLHFEVWQGVPYQGTRLSPWTILNR